MAWVVFLAFVLAASFARASTGDEHQFYAAFSQVKVGMTLDQVRKLGQVGNRCIDWPHQRPPACGPLHYFSDVRRTETASGTTTIYSYGREQIVLKDDVVVLIVR
jgi:hypothetical protein